MLFPFPLPLAKSSQAVIAWCASGLLLALPGVFTAQSLLSLRMAGAPAPTTAHAPAAENNPRTNAGSRGAFERPAVQFAAGSATASEADLAPVQVAVKRSGTAGALTVKYAVSGDAVNDKDYSRLSGMVTFQNGASTATITVQPLADYRIKDYRNMRKDRVLQLALSEGKNYAISKPSIATIEIKNSLNPKQLPSDELFFSRLNLNSPALASVKAAVDAKNYPLARTALAKHFRTRNDAWLPFERLEPSKQLLEAVSNNTYSVTGLTYTYKPNTVSAIDWSYSVEDNPNWSWEFNRFAWWRDLAQAYADNPKENEKYGRRVVDELDNWLNTSPLDITKQQLQPGNRWRTLETGIRLHMAWPFAFHHLRTSRLVSDELLVDWVKAFHMHGRFLEESAELYTNRGVGEATGLFMCSLFFPEFKDAADWRTLSITRLENVLKHDVLPDGSYKELSPGYHDHTLGSVQQFQEMAKGNNVDTSPAISFHIQKMFDYLMYASEPNNYMPFLNDSHKMYKSMRNRVASGALLFPEREDYKWFASNGQKGKPIQTTSHLFADGGQAVMRSGWTSTDSYLLMDAGPFGTSHGNEDKLSISVDGYGTRHIIDCGPYNYEDDNPFRIYSISTHGKSAPLVDNLNQNRRSAKPLYERKSPVAWYTSPAVDYAAGAYGADPDEVFGPEKARPAITTRHILYLKPDVWILVDAFQPLDQQAHRYSTLFQCSDDTLEIDRKQKAVRIQLKPGEFDPFNRVKTKALQPALTITPLLNNGQAMQIFKGQESPFIAGWQFEKSSSWKKQPIPTLRYDLKATGNAQMAYALTAAPAGKSGRRVRISHAPAVAGTFALNIREDSVPDRTLIIATGNKSIAWQGRQYEAGALLIEGKQAPVVLSKKGVTQK